MQTTTVRQDGQDGQTSQKTSQIPQVLQFPEVSPPKKTDPSTKQELLSHASELRKLTLALADTDSNGPAFARLAEMYAANPYQFAETLVFWVQDEGQRKELFQYYTGKVEIALQLNGEFSNPANAFSKCLSRLPQAVNDVYAEKLFSYLTTGSIIKAEHINPEELKDSIREKIASRQPVNLVLLWGGFKETIGKRMDFADKATLERLASICDHSPYPIEFELVFCDTHARNFNAKPTSAISQYCDDLAVRAFMVNPTKLNVSRLSEHYARWRLGLKDENEWKNLRDLCEKTVRERFQAEPSIRDLFETSSKKHSDFCSPLVFAVIRAASSHAVKETLSCSEGKSIVSDCLSAKISQNAFTEKIGELFSSKFITAISVARARSPMPEGFTEYANLRNFHHLLLNPLSKAASHFSAISPSYQNPDLQELAGKISESILRDLVSEIAIHYASTRQLESALIEHSNPNAVFVSFGDHEKESVFSDSPTLFYYPFRKHSDTPWYSDGNLLRFNELRQSLISPKKIEDFELALKYPKVRLPQSYAEAAEAYFNWSFLVSGMGMLSQKDEKLNLFSALIHLNSLQNVDKYPLFQDPEKRELAEFLANLPEHDVSTSKHQNRFFPIHEFLSGSVSSEDGAEKFAVLPSKVLHLRRAIGASTIYTKKTDRSALAVFNLFKSETISEDFKEKYGALEAEALCTALAKFTEEKLLAEVLKKFGTNEYGPGFWVALNIKSLKKRALDEQTARFYVHGLVAYAKKELLAQLSLEKKPEQTDILKGITKARQKSCFDLSAMGCAQIACERDLVAEELLLHDTNLSTAKHLFWSITPCSLASLYDVLVNAQGLVHFASLNYASLSNSFKKIEEKMPIDQNKSMATSSFFALYLAGRALSRIGLGKSDEKKSESVLQEKQLELAETLMDELLSLKEAMPEAFYGSLALRIMLFDDSEQPNSLTRRVCLVFAKEIIEAISSPSEPFSGPLNLRDVLLRVLSSYLEKEDNAPLVSRAPLDPFAKYLEK